MKRFFLVVAALLVATCAFAQYTRVGAPVAPTDPSFPATLNESHRGGWHTYPTLEDVPASVLEFGTVVYTWEDSRLSLYDDADGGTWTTILDPAEYDEFVRTNHVGNVNISGLLSADSAEFAKVDLAGRQSRLFSVAPAIWGSGNYVGPRFTFKSAAFGVENRTNTVTYGQSALDWGGMNHTNVGYLQSSGPVFAAGFDMGTAPISEFKFTTIPMSGPFPRQNYALVTVSVTQFNGRAEFAANANDSLAKTALGIPSANSGSPGVLWSAPYPMHGYGTKWTNSPTLANLIVTNGIQLGGVLRTTWPADPSEMPDSTRQYWSTENGTNILITTDGTYFNKEYYSTNEIVADPSSRIIDYIAAEVLEDYLDDNMVMFSTLPGDIQLLTIGTEDLAGRLRLHRGAGAYRDFFISGDELWTDNGASVDSVITFSESGPIFNGQAASAANGITDDYTGDVTIHGRVTADSIRTVSITSTTGWDRVGSDIVVRAADGTDPGGTKAGDVIISGGNRWAFGTNGNVIISGGTRPYTPGGFGSLILTNVAYMDFGDSTAVNLNGLQLTSSSPLVLGGHEHYALPDIADTLTYRIIESENLPEGDSATGFGEPHWGFLDAHDGIGDYSGAVYEYNVDGDGITNIWPLWQHGVGQGDVSQAEPYLRMKIGNGPAENMIARYDLVSSAILAGYSASEDPGEGALVISGFGRSMEFDSGTIYAPDGAYWSMYNVGLGGHVLANADLDMGGNDITNVNSIGTAEAPVQELYVSDGSIYVGGSRLSYSNGSMQVDGTLAVSNLSVSGTLYVNGEDYLDTTWRMQQEAVRAAELYQPAEDGTWTALIGEAGDSMVDYSFSGGRAFFADSSDTLGVVYITNGSSVYMPLVHVGKTNVHGGCIEICDTEGCEFESTPHISVGMYWYPGAAYEYNAYTFYTDFDAAPAQIRVNAAVNHVLGGPLTYGQWTSAAPRILMFEMPSGALIADESVGTNLADVVGTLSPAARNVRIVFTNTYKRDYFEYAVSAIDVVQGANPAPTESMSGDFWRSWNADHPTVSDQIEGFDNQSIWIGRNVGIYPGYFEYLLGGERVCCSWPNRAHRHLFTSMGDRVIEWANNFQAGCDKTLTVRYGAAKYNAHAPRSGTNEVRFTYRLIGTPPSGIVPAVSELPETVGPYMTSTNPALPITRSIFIPGWAKNVAVKFRRASYDTDLFDMSIAPRRAPPTGPQ